MHADPSEPSLIPPANAAASPPPEPDPGVALRGQFFLTFAVVGSVLPYLPLFLEDRGLSKAQNGAVQSMQGVAIMLTPVALTLLADLHVPTRRLMRWVYAFAGLSLVGMLVSPGYAWLFAAFTGFSLAFAPAMPLQDGLVFAEQSRHDKRHGQFKPRGSLDYHRVRVWGTLGFIAPSLAVYAALALGAPIDASIAMCAGVCVVAAWWAGRLPPGESTPSRSEGRGLASEPATGAGQPPPKKGSGLPTIEAAKALATPSMLLFCAGMWLLSAAMGAFYAFFPLLCTDHAGVRPEWVGPIISFGVVLEIAPMLAFGWMTRKLTLSGVVILGALLTAARMALLGWAPTVSVVVGAQLLHGMMVIALHVAPPVRLAQASTARSRASVHGLFLMAVIGTSGVAGRVGAGWLADAWSLPGVFRAAAWASLVGVVVLSAGAVIERAQPARSKS